MKVCEHLIKCVFLLQSLSPGFVETKLFESSGYTEDFENSLFESPVIQPEDIADTIIFILSTPYTINVTELTVEATGAK